MILIIKTICVLYFENSFFIKNLLKFITNDRINHVLKYLSLNLKFQEMLLFTKNSITLLLYFFNIFLFKIYIFHLKGNLKKI